MRELDIIVIFATALGSFLRLMWVEKTISRKRELVKIAVVSFIAHAAWTIIPLCEQMGYCNTHISEMELSNRMMYGLFVLIGVFHQEAIDAIESLDKVRGFFKQNKSSKE